MKNFRNRVFQASKWHATKRSKEIESKTINSQARFNTKFLIQFSRPTVFPIILVLIQSSRRYIKPTRYNHVACALLHPIYSYCYSFLEQTQAVSVAKSSQEKFEWIGRMMGSLWLYWSKIWHFVVTLIKISTHIRCNTLFILSAWNRNTKPHQ
jgi:AAA15 family ATPase/GTPase